MSKKKPKPRKDVKLPPTAKKRPEDYDPRALNNVAQWFKPGNDGHGGGPPKGRVHLKTLIQRSLAMPVELLPEQVIQELEKIHGAEARRLSVEQIMTMRQAMNAMAGDVQAFKALAEHAFDKPGQAVDHTSSDGSMRPMTIEILAPEDDKE